jgi:DNA recombination protein RmuC
MTIAAAVIALFLGAAIGFLVAKLRTAGVENSLRASLAQSQNEVAAATGQVRLLTEQIANLRTEQVKSIHLDEALKSVKESVSTLSTQALEANNRRVEAETSIKDQIVQMVRETTKFAGALSNSQTRGKYGETQLEMLLEYAELQEGVHFVRQSSSKNLDSQTLRPDIKILMPGGTALYVDSKFPFERFLEAYGADTAEEKARLMELHAKDLFKHVEALAKRGYHDEDDSPDFVVLFAPFESILSEALEADPQLLEKAFNKGVTIATPTTMLALLRTVGYVFGRSRMAQSASQIQELAGEFLKRVTTLHTKLGVLGERIKGAERAYNEVLATAETTVIRPAKKMMVLRGSGTTNQLKALPNIDDEVREFKSAKEISGPDEVLEIDIEIDEADEE